MMKFVYVLFLTALLEAQTFTVNTLSNVVDGSCSDENCSLADALNLYNTGDVINIGVSGTIILTSPLHTIYKTLTINGPSMNDLNISGNHLYSVFNHEGGTLSVNNLGIIDGNSTFESGGINSYQSNGRSRAELIVENVLFVSNKSNNGGGAIKSLIPIKISNSTFIDNSSNFGGAIYLSEGNSTITRSVFRSNYADSYGGGAIYYDHYNQNTIHVLSQSEFNGNYAVNGSNPRGGAIAVKANLDIDQSLFYGNTSNSFGGAVNIILYSAMPVSHGVNITNSTFFGNTAQSSWGGAISAQADSGVVNISFSTITQNQSHDVSWPSGGIFHVSGVVNIKSSVISYNYDTSGAFSALADCFTRDSTGFNSLGSNIMTKKGNCLLNVNDGILGANQLELLADNGGFTKTCAPKEISMLVNSSSTCFDSAGELVTVDQRGVPRSDGQCDIGAFEANSLSGFFPSLYYLLN